VSSQSDRGFSCTLGGTVALGRRRLARLLGGLGGLLLLTTIACWVSGRVFPGLLALLVGLVVAFAWRMSNDLVPRFLRFDDQALLIETPARLIPMPIADATIRRLEPDEIRHLEALTSAGGFVAGSGGFDSHHLGEFDLYGSDLANAVFIQGLEGRLIVTPDQPAEFIEAFRRHVVPPLLESRGHE